MGMKLLEGGVVSDLWQHNDYSQKLRGTFGRMTGLWKVHVALSKMRMLAELRRGDLLAGTIVQTLKAVHQVALDGGS